MPTGIYDRSHIDYSKRVMPKRVDRIVKICLNCDKEFKVLPCHSIRKYCSRICLTKSGVFQHNVPHTEKTLLKMRYLMKKQYENGRIHHYKGKQRDLKTRLKISDKLKGDKPWNKNISYQNVVNLFKGNTEYIKWRTLVFKRDNWICQKCKERGGKLEAHHIVSKKEIILKNNLKTLKDILHCKELWDINNGQTLCKDCHKLTDNYGYNNKNKTFYREYNKR